MSEQKECRNRKMQEKLNDGSCIDVNVIGVKEPHFPGIWVLDNYLDGVDYCDADTETWIWSIGKHRYTGVIYAAVDDRFYQNPLFECLWLR